MRVEVQRAGVPAVGIEPLGRLHRDAPHTRLERQRQIDDSFHGQGTARVQEGARYLESGGQLLFKPRTKEEGWVEFSFKVKEKEPLRLLLELTRSYDFGVWQPILNGVRLGERIDLYRPQPDLWEFHIMDFWPDPGEYTLRLECVGKNSESSGHNIGVNSIRLRERRP